MGYDDTVGFIFRHQLIDTACQPGQDLERHVLGTDIGDLFP